MNIKEECIWVANTLFKKGLVSGSTGNISYKENDYICISKSGSCFGLLDANSFAKVSLDGQRLEGNPSKEWPMHLRLYQENNNTNAIIHTHSFYSTLYSCLDEIDINDLFKYTPYLKMQTNGNINIIEYGKPGSEDLFTKFNSMVNKETNCYLLRNHGIFVASTSLLKAFYIIEEFEQSSRIALSIKDSLKYKTIYDEAINKKESFY